MTHIRIAVMLALTFSPTTLANGAMDTFGVDARSRAMGGAQTAASTSGSAAHTNPAALGLMRSAEISGGFSLTLPDAHIDTAHELDDGHPLTPSLPPSYAGYQLVFGIPFWGVFQDWLTFGGSFYFPAFVLTHVRADDPARPFLYMYDTATDHYEAVLGGALSFFGYGSLGAGVRMGAGQRGYVRAVVDPLTQEIVDQRIDAFQYTIVAPVVGALVGPLGPKWANIRGGLSYRGALSTPMTVPAYVGIAGLDVSIFAPIETVANFSPAGVSAGVAVDVDAGAWDRAFRMLGAMTMTADVQYMFWSGAPSPHLGVTLDVYGDDVDALGLGSALDAPADGTNRVVPPELQDTLVVRVGGEYRPLDGMLALRAGYFYRPTPVPDQTSGTSLMDSTVHGVSAGAGLDFGAAPLVDGRMFLDIAWQTHLFMPRTATKSAPDDPLGAVTVRGQIHELGVTVGYRFE
jgi:long-chain fatty acid transport protein